MPVEDILEMHNVDDTLTDVERYNSRMWCHYIAWDLKIHMGNLNEVKNDFTWMKIFTRVFHNMYKADISNICNGKKVLR